MSSWRKDLEIWPRSLPKVDLLTNKTALLIIDMQYYDTHPDYGLANVMKQNFPEMFNYYYTRLEKTVIPNNQVLLSFFRKNGLKVVFLTFGPELPDSSDLTPLRRKKISQQNENTGITTAFNKGCFEHQVIKELEPEPNELVLNKNSAGAFSSTAIDQLLHNMGITRLIITGAVTANCVETTAREAADRGYGCILVEDACVGFDQSSHEATLRIFARMFGEVCTTKETLDRLNVII